MNPLLIGGLVLGGLWLLSSGKPAHASKPAKPSEPAPVLVRGAGPWKHEGVSYKALEWSNGWVDLVGTVGDRMATVRYQSKTHLAVLQTSGDPDLVNVMRAYMQERGSLI